MLSNRSDKMRAEYLPVCIWHLEITDNLTRTVYRCSRIEVEALLEKVHERRGDTE